MEEYVTDMLGRRINTSNRKPYKAKSTIAISLETLNNRDDTLLYWLGGGGFLLNARGTIVLFDPVLVMDKKTMRSETGHKMLMEYPISAESLTHVDVVFYTHPDLDHVGSETSKIISRHCVPRIAPARVIDLLYQYGVSKDETTICKAGDVFQIKNCKIVAIPADHPWQLINPNIYGKPLGKNDCCGYLICTPDGRFLLPGDTRLLESHYNIPDVDVVLLDTAKCAFHLNVEGAILLANAYPNAQLIPYHYGLFDEPTIPAQENGDPQDVFQYISNSAERVNILAPGEPFILSNRKKVK